ncbi:MAG: OmpH family outer membrane protein [Gammaproteobacteria bacterium]|nr:OmpH family outer membrane protein [Gammaproteobacteria bacterium]
MKKNSFYIIAVLVFCVSGVFRNIYAADLKVGFVNLVKVEKAAPQVQAAYRRLEKEFEPREREIIRAQKKIQREEKRLEKDSAIMSEEEILTLTRRIKAKKRDVKRSEVEFQEDLAIRRSKEYKKLQKKLYEAIKSLAKEEDYDLILSEGVIWASDRVDITDELLRRLHNEK